MSRRPAVRSTVRPTVRPRPPYRSPNTGPAFFAALVWLGVAALAYGAVGQPFLAWIAGGTVAAFALFAFDKGQSKGSGRRIPEVVLLGVVLLGGVVGGWLGMLLVRHKTRHTIFWVVQWLASALHLSLAWWLI